jgi:hypothetical protein
MDTPSNQKIFKTPGEILEIYNSGYSLKKIGEMFGVSQERIRQLLNKTKEYVSHPTYRPSIVRFWSKVEKSDNCWIWIGAKTPEGYGRMRWMKGYEYAHRISWVIQNGTIADDLCVCHSCDNPSCVRPDHLFIGTIADNMHDRDTKGRGRKPKVNN